MVSLAGGPLHVRCRRRVTPETIVPRVDPVPPSGLPDDASWSQVRPLVLLRAEDGGVPSQATEVRLAHDASALFLRFDCDDGDVWATYTRRDAPLWEEEVVEVFIAPGDADPAAYVEIEVNPLGAVFDARVTNPHGRRDSMHCDTSWNAPGLVVAVDRSSAPAWRVDMAIRWADLCAGNPPRSWRANFFRIDRPRGGADEFSAWAPTFVRPADFHKPARFGRLVLGDGAGPR